MSEYNSQKNLKNYPQIIIGTRHLSPQPTQPRGRVGDRGANELCFYICVNLYSFWKMPDGGGAMSGIFTLA